MTTSRGSAALRLGLISLDFPSWQECVDEAADRELDAVEIYVSPGFGLKDAKALKKRCDERGVTLAVISCLAKLSQAEDDVGDHLALITSAMRAAESIDVRNVGFMYGGCARLGRHAARERFLARVTPLVEAARRSGVRLLIENVFSRHPSGDLDSVDHVLELFNRLDPSSVALNFDPGNFAVAGEEAYPYAFEVLRPYIGGIHLKDVARYRYERHQDGESARPLQDYARGLFLTEPLGEGSLNCSGLVRALLGWDDCPPVMLEPFCADERRRAWLDRSLSFVREVTAAEAMPDIQEAAGR
jgi:sugar phosphate isomerase/epimerase